ncbi:MAG: HAMP domain-containing histidine kinase [Leptospiraceae bacterium]|nr:HAMP domain-containing histidine kinase [Leptospiraceae bacterium]
MGERLDDQFVDWLKQNMGDCAGPADRPRIETWWLVRQDANRLTVLAWENRIPNAWQRALIQSWWFNHQDVHREQVEWMQQNHLYQAQYADLNWPGYEQRRWQDRRYLRTMAATLFILDQSEGQGLFLQCAYPAIYFEAVDAESDFLECLQRKWHRFQNQQRFTVQEKAARTRHDSKGSQVTLDIARLTHDFRKPLASLSMNYENLSSLIDQLDDAGSPDIKAALEITLKRAASQLTLLESFTHDLLVLQAPDQAQLEREFCQCDLNSMIKELVQDFEQTGAFQKIRVHTEFSSDGWCRAVPNDLIRILYNLLSNALVHGSRGKDLYLETNRRGRWLSFSIEDDGPGLATQNTILELARRNLSRHGGGWGLGLASAARLASGLGGRLLHLPPQRARGANFLLVLPAAAKDTAFREYGSDHPKEPNRS